MELVLSFDWGLVLQSTVVRGVLVFVAFVLGFFWLVMPLVIRSRMPMSLHPGPVAIGTDELAADEADYIFGQAADLEGVGFRKHGLLRIRDMIPGSDMVGLLLHNPAERTAALVTCIRQSPVSPRAFHYVEFSTDFVDGRQLDTNNAPELNAGTLPTVECFRFEEVSDPRQLFALHQARLRRSYGGLPRRALRADLDAADAMRAQMADEMQQKVRLGRMRPVAGVARYGFSLTSAYRMTWGELWPVKPIRVYLDRRRAAAVRAEEGL